MLATCKIRDVEPYAWMKILLKVVPYYRAKRLEKLLLA